MKTFFWGTLLVCLVVLSTITGLAQNSNDALRLSTPGLTIGARSLGMGSVWTGTANDYSAMYTNPAGLGQVRTSEISVGLSNLSFNNTSTFFGNAGSMSSSSTSLNNVGFVYPFPTTRGSMVFSAGYVRDADYTSALAFNGFNPSSTMINALVNYGTDGERATLYDWYIADKGPWRTRIVDSLQQQGRMVEGGGTNNWVVAGAIEAARNLYFGISLTFVSGSYTFVKSYTETDTRNKYTVQRFDSGYALTSFNVNRTINEDIGGYTAKLGIVYRPNVATRLGLSIKLPTYYAIQETYTDDWTGQFDVADPASGSNTVFSPADGRPEFDVHTPFVFNAGFSYALGNLLLAGDVDYTDWTQMSFANADPSIEAINTDIKELYQATANLRVGAEFEFPQTGIRIRAGYAYLPSALKGDPSDFARKYITGGVGFIIDDMVAIDFGYARGSYTTNHSNYYDQPDLSVTTEKVTTNSIIGTVSYRF